MHRPTPDRTQGFTTGPSDEDFERCANIMIRMLVVEDHEFVRDALAGLLAEVPGMAVVGAASNLSDAKWLVEQHGPDVVLADLSLGDGSALDLAQWIRRSGLDARMVVVTGFGDTFAAVEALSHGAMGYVLKTQSIGDLLSAIHAVADGRSYVAPEVAAKLPQPSGATRSPPVKRSTGLEALSRRECEIFRHAIEGCASGDIARRLCISLKTVEFHRTNINRKLGVRTIADLLRFAVAHGIAIAPRAPEPSDVPTETTEI
jgi:two-component system response regulator NreC